MGIIYKYQKGKKLERGFSKEGAAKFQQASIEGLKESNKGFSKEDSALLAKNSMSAMKKSNKKK